MICFETNTRQLNEWEHLGPSDFSQDKFMLCCQLGIFHTTRDHLTSAAQYLSKIPSS